MGSEKDEGLFEREMVWEEAEKRIKSVNGRVRE
jgi:hypothetical protein